MNTLINILPWQPGYSGFSSYVRRILPGITGARLQLDRSSRATCLLNSSLQLLPDQLPSHFFISLLHRYSLTQYGVNVKDALRDASFQPDRIYSPYCNWLNGFAGLPQLITCHDLTPLYVPNSRRAWLHYRLLIPHHLKQASAVIAISKFVADQLIHLGIPATKIEVIPNGIAIERPAITRAASADLLMLARHDGNKNVAYVLEAFASLLKRFPDWPGVLRVVGKPGRQTALLAELRLAMVDPQCVLFIPKASADQLIHWLRSSLALISASFMEGFDYPVLEAKAEGLPTLISAIPVHHELHDSSSLFFSLSDAGLELQNQLFSLYSDPQLWSQLSQQGYARAQQLGLVHQQLQVQAAIQALR